MQLGNYVNFCLKAGGANTGETSVEMANCRNFRMLKVKVKVELRVKVSAAQSTKAQRGSRGKLYLSLPSVLDGVGC